uniref:Uncharacterized protein n=1 Tax=Phasianus colchicus TaxID=9054 RepID=A0A669PQL4_PHACC
VSEMLSRVAPCQWSLTCAVSALTFLSCHCTLAAPRPHSALTHSSPLALPKSSQSIWLMVRFCSTDISEIMSLDLRRSSMCTDCHRPTDTNNGRNKLGKLSCRDRTSPKANLMLSTMEVIQFALSSAPRSFLAPLSIHYPQSPATASSIQMTTYSEQRNTKTHRISFKNEYSVSNCCRKRI